MFEKLKEASTILLVPAAILYCFGFISVNSYFARFGIISFDVVNLRFVIAGFYPLISLMLVVYLTWHFYKNRPDSLFFGLKNWRERYKIHFLFILFTSGAAFVLSLLMQLGTYESPSAQQTLIYKPFFGGNDFIGTWITNLPLDNSMSMNTIVKTCLNFFPYLFILMAIIVLFRAVLLKVGFHEKVDSESTITMPKTSQQLLEQSPKKVNEKIYRMFFSFLVFFVDVFIVCLYIALIIYSYRKLHVELFDFQSFVKFQPLSQGLLFAWLFYSIIFIYIFLVNSEFFVGLFKDGMKASLLDYGTVQLTIQQLIIPVFLSLIMFGATIFPKIPFAIGGGEPRLVKLTMNDSKRKFDDDKMFLIGESSQFFFVIATSNTGEKGRALQINKSTVAYIETKSIGEESKSEINTEP